MLNCAVSVVKTLDDLVEVYSLKNLKLSGHLLEMVKTFDFGGLELDKFVLFNLLQLELVFEAFDDFVLHGHLVLYFLELLLQDLLPLLRLSQLLPQCYVRCQLLLEIFHLEVVL